MQKGNYMAYLLVLITLFCMTVKGYCGKKASVYAENTGDAFLFNLARMVFCALIGLGIVLLQAVQQSLAVEKSMLLLCLFSGACNASFLVGWLLAVKRNALVTVDVTLTVGSLIPAVLCAVLFGQSISPLKMFGYSLIVAAAVILSGYRQNSGERSSVTGILLLLLAVAGDGLSGFCQQLYNQYYTETGTRVQDVCYPNSVYQFYTYVFSMLILLLIFLFYCLRNKRFSKKIFRPLAKPLPHIAMMAVCLFAANYLQTMVTGTYRMPSQILYPVIKGGCLITVNLTAMLFFGEKPTWRSIAGSLAALAGIVVVNVL